MIQQAKCPVEMVGDFDQTLNDFRHTVNKNACEQREYCVLPAESKTDEFSHVIDWYNIVQLDSLSAQWLEVMTGKRMQSVRPRDQCTCER